MGHHADPTLVQFGANRLQPGCDREHFSAGTEPPRPIVSGLVGDANPFDAGIYFDHKPLNTVLHSNFQFVK